MKNFESFLTEKGITKEQFSEKSAEEMAGLYNEFNTEAQKALNEAIEAKATKEDIDALKAELMESRTEQMKSLNDALKEMGLAIKKLKIGEKTEDGPLSMVDALKAVKDDLTALKTGDKTEWISFKAVGTMTSANISGGNVPVEQRLSGFDRIATRRTRLMDVVSRGAATSNVISWVSQAAKEGAAGPTGEGLTKNQIDFDLVVNQESLKKMTAFIKVSDEMIDDIPFMASEINNELMVELMLIIESQLYSGDGTGNNLNGIATQASAFDAGSFAGTVDNANFVDVLRVAMNQIEAANQEPATAIFAHPSSVTKLLLIKASTSDKRYVDALQLVAGQLMLDGVPIIKTTLVSSADYLVGHFPNATVYDKGEVSIEVGLDGNDFTKNLRTVRGEWRGLNIIKTNKTASFVGGIIATDAAALETI